MKSLYQIDSELQEILNAIEEADGEITDEQIEALSIGREELEHKLDNYRKAYLSIQKDIEFAKNEKKRIDVWKHTKELASERLKSNMLDAVLNYGEIGKSGNRTIDVDGGKLFTKNVYSIEVNQTIWNHIKDIVVARLRELWMNGMLNAEDNGGYIQPIDVEGFVDSVNANYLAEYPDEANAILELHGHLLTRNDLMMMKINVQFDVNLEELLHVDKFNIVNCYFDNEDKATLVDNVDKKYIKEMLKYDKQTIVVEECITPSLNIK